MLSVLRQQCPCNLHIAESPHDLLLLFIDTDCRAAEVPCLSCFRDGHAGPRLKFVCVTLRMTEQSLPNRRRCYLHRVRPLTFLGLVLYLVCDALWLCEQTVRLRLSIRRPHVNDVWDQILSIGNSHARKPHHRKDGTHCASRNVSGVFEGGNVPLHKSFPSAKSYGHS